MAWSATYLLPADGICRGLAADQAWVTAGDLVWPEAEAVVCEQLVNSDDRQAGGDFRTGGGRRQRDHRHRAAEVHGPGRWPGSGRPGLRWLVKRVAVAVTRYDVSVEGHPHQFAAASPAQVHRCADVAHHADPVPSGSHLAGDMFVGVRRAGPVRGR